MRNLFSRQVADLRDKGTVTRDVEYAKAGEVRLTLEVYASTIDER